MKDYLLKVLTTFSLTAHSIFALKLQEAGIASYSKRLTRPPIVGPRLPAAHGNGRLALAESYMTS